MLAVLFGEFGLTSPEATPYPNPTVNVEFLRSLQEDIGKKTLLDLGPCGLHTIHGALQFDFKPKGSPSCVVS